MSGEPDHFKKHIAIDGLQAIAELGLSVCRQADTTGDTAARGLRAHLWVPAECASRGTASSANVDLWCSRNGPCSRC